MTIFANKQATNNFINTATYAEVKKFNEKLKLALKLARDEDSRSELIYFMTQTTWQVVANASNEELTSFKNEVFNILKLSIDKQDRSRLSYSIRKLSEEISLRNAKKAVNNLVVPFVDDEPADFIWSNR